MSHVTQASNTLKKSKIVTEMKTLREVVVHRAYDYSGKASSRLYAQKLLETGVIKKVYFASESLKLIDMAKAFFQTFQNALYVSDKMVGAEEEEKYDQFGQRS